MICTFYILLMSCEKILVRIQIDIVGVLRLSIFLLIYSQRIQNSTIFFDWLIARTYIGTCSGE